MIAADRLALGIEPNSPLSVADIVECAQLAEANGFAAVTSTGGAATFKSEWADAIANVPEVYVCFDRDPVGYEGMVGVSRLTPRAWPSGV